MRLHYLVLLIGAAFAGLDASSVTMKSSVHNTHIANSLDSMHNIVTTRNLLRVESDDEERVIPVVGKLTDILEKGALTVAQNARIRTWLMKGTSTDSAFKALELNMAGSKILENPKFLTWAIYVAKVEKQNPEEIILSKLMTQYAHDTLAKMFTAAEGVPKMKDLVTSLQAQQRQVWLRADESTNAVYKLLRLDETGTDLFKSPQFSTWTSYVDAFNTKYPEETVSIFAKLTKNYDDVTLSMMLEAAMKIPRTEVIATNLQAQLQTKRIQAWIASGKSTDYVFKLLKLDETGTNPFKSFQITTWVSYVDAFNKNFPDEAISAMSKVSKTLSKTYDDLTLTDMLEAAKSIPATKKVASELQRQQNQTWLANGKTVDDIFTLFKLNKPSLENLVNPRLGAWSSFVREYNMGVDPGKEASLIATMTFHYTDLGLAQLLQKGKTVDETKKIAEDLQIAQFNRWLYQEKTQDDVIELLGLKLDTWFSNPDRIIVLNYRRFYKAHEVIARPDVI